MPIKDIQPDKVFVFVVRVISWTAAHAWPILVWLKTQDRHIAAQILALPRISFLSSPITIFCLMLATTTRKVLLTWIWSLLQAVCLVALRTGPSSKHRMLGLMARSHRMKLRDWILPIGTLLSSARSSTSFTTAS
ncbi:hypothetical protein HD806DRAFT_474921 [Xylariaceae sp. AK1471]|nr:hypothetical protein HD806DRAFT_474921 [Xylariaceae sp. AK1471]